MPIKMSKDGQQFFDVDESMDSIEAAKAKGYDEYVPVTKNGRDVFNIVATPGSLDAARAKGYVTPGMAPDPQKPVNQATSAYKGAIEGASQGWVDELSGRVEQAGSLAGVRGLGGEWGDIRRERPDEAGQSMGDIYKQGRDRRRASDDNARESNPKSFIGGAMLGGVASAGPLGAASLPGAIGVGALGGAGASREEDLGGVAKDAAIGGGAGAAGYGLGVATGKVAGSVIPAVKAAARGAKAGATEAAQNSPPIGGVKAVFGGAGAVKGALQEMGKTFEGRAEVSKLADTARQVLRGGENGSIGPGASDEEAVMAAMISDGDNPVKRFFASKSTVLNPANHTADQYNAILAMPSAEREAARAFVPREAAKELKPQIESVDRLFDKARGDRFNELQGIARAKFDPDHVGPVVNGLESAIEQGGRLESMPASATAVLRDARRMLTQGEGLESQRLTPGELHEVDAAELFHRLQKGREFIDSKLKWAGKNGEVTAESLLKGVRDKFDAALKTLPEKASADEMYRASKGVEKNFFAATEFGKKGNVQVDEGKIGALTSNTDRGHRFRAAMEELKAFASREDLSPEFRAEAAKTLANIEAKIGLADKKRMLESFRQAAGPTSPAVERMQSILGKHSPLQEAANAPSGFVRSVDNLSDYVRQQSGKGLGELTPDEKIGVVRFWTWWKNNRDAPEQQVLKQWNRYSRIKP